MSRRLLQLALDVTDVATALKVAVKAAPAVDIVEDGTVLCLAKGVDSMRDLRAVLPGKTLLADIRIARAGEKFANLYFEAGASRVSVVGESGLDVIRGACKAASRFGGGVEVELFPGWNDDDIRGFIDAGVKVIIVHRDTCTPEEDQSVRNQLFRLRDLVPSNSVSITLAGGLNATSLKRFVDCPFDIAVVGSAIVKADDPFAAAQALRAAL
ncbi:orotidine 5'-phosphate decarboxylase / HUMPS family protein [Bifidobacterium sp. ESL0732]|uniref:orotidine 5'-phosphate decarboxylase / HUMPS family protein n=1 Tax=Bifidobacterium sp. ESL0732 TaxID=2983222 RepID=UPI0023F984A6|nr:orotidine 5'-phosphate decarboxylase / HUMPS family protein [Bifidobacterium sp. ESL0732]WEV64673.1 orotidine 5'-phosphate decarboxylase [Bifidobacterium sp. ESL0732]